jgi:hypothetical protein
MIKPYGIAQHWQRIAHKLTALSRNSPHQIEFSQISADR